MLALTRLEEDGLFFLGTSASAALVTPAAISVARRIGLVDRPAPNKFHHNETPYLGGLAIVGPTLLALVIALFTLPSDVHRQLLAIGLGGLAVAGVGLRDDWAPLKPAPRLAVQVAAAIGLWSTGIRVAPTGMPPADLALTVLVVVAITNAINLLDNMDGLSSGTVAIASTYLFVAAYWGGQHLVPVMALALAGACVGFLPYNFNPARIFLGDAGTLYMGFLLATLAIKLSLVGYPVITRITVPLLILSVPLFDMTLVVLSRWRAGRPVFQGGTDHSSHRIVAMGGTPRTAAWSTYAVSAVTGGTAVALLRLRSAAWTWGLMCFSLGAGVLLLWLLEAWGPAADGREIDRQRARHGGTTVVASGRLRQIESEQP